MSPHPQPGILCSGKSAWAFESLAARLADVLWVDVITEPAEFNYVLAYDDLSELVPRVSFIPYDCMVLASDKRTLAGRFATTGVPTPATYLCSELAVARRVAAAHPNLEWCLKYPTGTGAAGHRLLTPETSLPRDWPRPLVLQEFVRLEQPEVYRMYCAGGTMFGWVARRTSAGSTDPWVAHARGAHYERCGTPPEEAVSAARAALEATGLVHSFGCADLLLHPDGRWLVLEVGTDGVFNYVDRELGDPQLEREIEQQIASAFWNRVGSPPWSDGAWRPRSGS